MGGYSVGITYGSTTNKMLDLPTAVKDGRGNTVSSAFHLDGKLKNTFISGTISAGYTYTNNNLTQIDRGGWKPGESGADKKKTQSYAITYDPFDQVESISVGTYDLVNNTYDTAGNLYSQVYGNADSVDYTYDHLGRLKTSSTSDGKDIEYFYTGDGQLGRVVSGTRAQEYTYDSLGRLVGSTTSSSSTTKTQLWQEYNTNNQLSKQILNFVDKTYSLGYTYDSYGRLTKYSSPVGNVQLAYDGLSRLSTATYPDYKATYTYTSGSGMNATTNLVSKVTLTANSSSFSPLTYQYTYDANGNILTISDSSGNSRAYTYDAQGQMLTESFGETVTYTYDTYGNIRTVGNGVYLNTYKYEDPQWLDRLTSYNGGTITYDDSGNPTSYYNGTRWTMKWENGRELEMAAGTSGGMEYEIHYEYGPDGLHTSKAVTNVDSPYTTNHYFYYANGKLVREVRGSSVLDFIYDQNGNPYALIYNGTTYFYVLNPQGDVVRLINTSGTTVATYYNACWGDTISNPTGSMANINPLRYRGYYYDTETRFYYLQSRYYDPEIGRFINGDFASLDLFCILRK